MTPEERLSIHGQLVRLFTEEHEWQKRAPGLTETGAIAAHFFACQYDLKTPRVGRRA